LQDRNHFQLSLNMEKEILTDLSINLFWKNYVWIDVVILILAAASLSLTWKYIYDISYLYNELKLKYGKDELKKEYRKQKQQLRKIKEENQIFKMETLRGQLHKKGTLSEAKRSESSLQSKDLQSDFTEVFISDKSRIQEELGLDRPLMLWSDLTFKDKAKLFSPWSLFSIIMNIVQIFGAITNILNSFGVLP